MTALERAVEHLQRASTELDAAKLEAPAYAVDRLIFVRAELGVVRRRLERLCSALDVADPGAAGPA